jgi:hypothetical protein
LGFGGGEGGGRGEGRTGAGGREVGGERARGSRAGRRAGLYSGLAVFGTVLANKKLLLRVLGERRGAAAAGRRAAAAVRPCWLGRLAPWLLACCVAAGGKKKTAAGGKCVRVALPRWRGMDGGGGRAELRRRLSLPACSKLAAGARSLRSGRWVVVHGLAREGRRGEETAAFHRAGRVNRGGGINQQHLYLHAW